MIVRTTARGQPPCSARFRTPGAWPTSQACWLREPAPTPVARRSCSSAGKSWTLWRDSRGSSPTRPATTTSHWHGIPVRIRPAGDLLRPLLPRPSRRRPGVRRRAAPRKDACAHDRACTAQEDLSGRASGRGPAGPDGSAGRADRVPTGVRRDQPAAQSESAIQNVTALKTELYRKEVELHSQIELLGENTAAVVRLRSAVDQLRTLIREIEHGFVEFQDSAIPLQELPALGVRYLDLATELRLDRSVPVVRPAMRRKSAWPSVATCPPWQPVGTSPDAGCDRCPSLRQGRASGSARHAPRLR